VIELILTVNPSYFMSDTVEICEGESYIFFGKSLETEGIYLDTFPTINACDSVFELVLIVNPLPEIPIITKNENTLTSSVSDSYQWYHNGVPVPSATAQTYTYTQNGKYWVSVTNEFGCTSISEEMDVDDVGIAETHCNASLRVYPNPTTGQLIIDNGELTIENVEIENVEIYSVVGQKLLSIESLKSTETTIDVQHLANGMYFLKVGNQVVRFLKEQ